MFLIFIFSLPGSYFYLPSWSYCAENTPDSFQLLCISAYLCLSTCPLPGQKTKHFPGQGFSHRPHVDHPPLNSYRVSFLACGSGLATVYSMKLSHNKVPMGIPQGEKTWWASEIHESKIDKKQEGEKRKHFLAEESTNKYDWPLQSAQ